MANAVDTPPTDPESAALDLLVRIAETRPRATALHAVMRELAGALQLDGALAGLADLADARLTAATIAEVVVSTEDPAGALRIRAAIFRAGCRDCSNPRLLADALDGAARVWDQL